jgi:Rab family protein
MTATEKPPYKLLLIGAAYAGKTCLKNAFLKKPFNCDRFPTLAPAWVPASVDVDGEHIPFQLWDTIGQERCQKVSDRYYGGAGAAIVVYDKWSVDSVGKWTEEVRAMSPNATIFLAATKSDLMSYDEIDAAKKKGDEKKAEINAQAFFLTSAKKNLEVEPLFIEAAKAAKLNTPPPA